MARFNFAHVCSDQTLEIGPRTLKKGVSASEVFNPNIVIWKDPEILAFRAEEMKSDRITQTSTVASKSYIMPTLLPLVSGLTHSLFEPLKG